VTRRMGTAVALAAAIAGLTCASASATLPEDTGISYGPSAGEKGTVFPSTKPGSTIVVLVHGGGWRTQLYEIEDAPQAKALQLKGYTVFDIDYDQDSPTVRAFPLEVGEVAAATRWIIGHAASYNGNAANVVLVGGSAGGELVAMAADILDGAEPGTVQGVISLSGGYDFPSLVRLAIAKEIRDLNYIKSIGQALGCSNSLLTCSTSFEEEWSPDLHLPPVGCPAWLLAASEQVPWDVREAELMLAHLGELACPAAFHEVATGHGFSLWPEVSSQIYEFIHTH
jgi:acetyl esterase/lipase